MKTVHRRQFLCGVGAVLGSALVGCGEWQRRTAESGVTVFVNGTILPVDVFTAVRPFHRKSDKKPSLDDRSWLP